MISLLLMLWSAVFAARSRQRVGCADVRERKDVRERGRGRQVAGGRVGKSVSAKFVFDGVARG